MLKYSEDINFASHKDMGPKDFFEIACNNLYRFNRAHSDASIYLETVVKRPNAIFTGTC